MLSAFVVTSIQMVVSAFDEASMFHPKEGVTQGWYS